MQCAQLSIVLACDTQVSGFECIRLVCWAQNEDLEGEDLEFDTE